jgi:hypothetical protein
MWARNCLRAGINLRYQYLYSHVVCHICDIKRMKSKLNQANYHFYISVFRGALKYILFFAETYIII